MGKYFGTDGFRGEAGVTLTATHAYRIGRFLGSGEGGRRPRVVVGKDTRLSCYMLEYALIAGLTASGAEVSMLHVTTTPNVCHTVVAERFDLGVMISASHNPYQDNGLKLIGPDGAKADDATTDRIERYLDGELAALGLAADIPFATGERIGKIFDHAVGRERYLQYLVSAMPCELHGFRVGLDPANGAAAALAPAVFAALGADVYPIHAKPNGTNINRKSGALHTESLVQHVLANGLDVGFAFDGDADRCIAVSAEGEVINGDHMLFILAEHLKKQGRLAGNTVVTTVMSNLGLYRALEAAGTRYVQTAVGDRFVYENMRENGYVLGGEQAGHIILSEHATTGDGILTALKLMEVMVTEKKTLHELAAPVTMLPQLTRNVRVADKAAVRQNAAVQAAVAAVQARLGKNGRVILRESGTEPVMRVMVEAETEAACRTLAEEIAATIAAEGLATEM